MTDPDRHDASPGGLARPADAERQRALPSSIRTWLCRAAAVLLAGPVLAADDHGDSPANASRLAIDGHAYGIIAPDVDSDWFAFETKPFRTYTVHAERQKLWDVAVAVFESDGDTRLQEADTVTGEQAAVAFVSGSAGGTYYARVRSFAQFALGSYIIRVTESVGPYGLPPRITLPADRTVVLGDSVQLDIAAVDPEGAPVSFTDWTVPSGAAFVDHGNGTARVDWLTGSVTDIGKHEIHLTVTDGGLQTQASMNLHVTSLQSVDVSEAVVRPGRKPLLIAWSGLWALDDVRVVLLGPDQTSYVLNPNVAAPTASVTWESPDMSRLPPGNGYRIVLVDNSRPTDYRMSPAFRILRAARNDFDRDGRTDPAVYDPVRGDWYLLRSRSGVEAVNWGFAGCRPVPADYDGNGAFDTAVYHASTGTWYLRMRANPRDPASAVRIEMRSWGFSGCVPVPGDYDGDGTDDLAVYDTASGRWFVLSLDGSVLVHGLNWGFGSCLPMPADIDGDGTSDLVVYDPDSATWFALSLTDGILGPPRQWGFAGCRALLSDMDGDGRADPTVFHAAGGRWYTTMHRGDPILFDEPWGYPGCLPLCGDIDGDGIDDFIVYDRATGQWFVRSHARGQVLLYGTQWGWNGAVPAGGPASW